MPVAVLPLLSAIAVAGARFGAALYHCPTSPEAGVGVNNTLMLPAGTACRT